MTKSIALTSTEKTSLSSNIADLNKLIIILTKQIMVVQQELSILIGAPYSATFLAVEKIDLVILNVIIHNNYLHFYRLLERLRRWLHQKHLQVQQKS